MNFKAKRKSIYISILLLVISIVTGGSVYSATNEPIKVAHNALLTGPVGIVGELSDRAIRAAIEVIRDEGGVINGRNFELKTVDSEGRVDVEIRNLRRLVAEGYKFIIDSGSTAQCGAAQHAAPGLNAVIINVSAMSTFLRGPDYYQKNFFLTTMPNDAVVKALVKRLVEEGYTGLRWVGLNPDYGFGHDSWTMFKKFLKEYDPTAEIVGELFHPFREANMVPYIEKALAANPGAIMSSSYGGDLYNILSQAAPRGLFKDTILATFDIMEGLKIGAGEVVPTTVVAARECWAINPSSPLSRKKYQEKYWKIYGEKPIYHQSCSYDGLIILAEAIRKAGSTDVDKVISALNNLEYSGSLGKSIVREGDHQVEYPFVPTYKVVPAPGEPKPDWLRVPKGGWKLVEPYGIPGCFPPPEAYGWK